MRLIEKALLGLTAIGTAGVVTSAVMQGMACEEATKINEKTNKLKVTSGYTAASFEFKNQQIAKLMQDYSLGLMSDQDLVERIREDNLSELDFDVYAKNHFNDKEYQDYLSLKEETAKNEKLNETLPSCILASITVAGASVGLFTGIAIDEKKRQQHNKGLHL